MSTPMRHCGLSREQCLLQAVQNILPRYWVKLIWPVSVPALFAVESVIVEAVGELAEILLLLLGVGGTAAAIWLECLRLLPRGLELVLLVGAWSATVVLRFSATAGL